MTACIHVASAFHHLPQAAEHLPPDHLLVHAFWLVLLIHIEVPLKPVDTLFVQVLLPEEKWNNYHLRFIYFGREHCPAQHHDPSKCPGLLCHPMTSECAVGVALMCFYLVPYCATLVCAFVFICALRPSRRDRNAGSPRAGRSRQAGPTCHGANVCGHCDTACYQQHMQITCMTHP